MKALLLALPLVGCSAKQPEEYTFEDVYAYTSCTARERAGIDPASVSPSRAVEIVDRCDEQLRAAAQALAARRAFEDEADPLYPNMTANHFYAKDREILRDMALCATSAEIDAKLCPRIH